MILEIIGVFLAAFFSDVLWMLFIIHIAKGDAMASATTGAIVYVFGGLITITYVGNPWMLIPAVIGGFFGTYITVTIDKNNERKSVQTNTQTNLP